MQTSLDFLNLIDHDSSLKILWCLDDIADIVRVGAVSRSWRHFVIANGLSKQFCLRMFPHLLKVNCVVEPAKGVNTSLELSSSSELDPWETLEREHRAYAFLARGCTTFPIRECIISAISASSTDNYPIESILNTLVPVDRVAGRPSYWSSKGQKDPSVPERLTYKLIADICVITEIHIQPFQAFFQWGVPIYSAQYVRFRLGHPKVPINDQMDDPFDCNDDDRFMWTYTSPEFPMVQENSLQRFKLLEPVICIGGIIQIELLGRVQRQEIDGLFYICVCHVQVLGRHLSPAFDVEVLEPSGSFKLKAQSYTQPKLCELEPVRHRYLEGRARDLELIVNLLRGVEAEAYAWIEEDDDVVEDAAL